MPFQVVVEGDADVPVVTKIARSLALPIGKPWRMRGKDRLDACLSKYNEAAQYSQNFWWVLRDLDHDERCAALFVQSRLPDKSQHMLLRLAVRQAEAWLLADVEGIADYLAVSKNRFPKDPESVTDPKLELVDIARRSRKKDVKRSIVPAPGTSSKTGPGYIAAVIEMCDGYWEPDRARSRSNSLDRCLTRLAEAKESAR